MNIANSLLDTKNVYSKYWININEKNLPSFANKIITINFKKFKKLYHNNKDTKDKSKLVKSLLRGDIYILKNAFKKKLLYRFKDYVIQKFSENKSRFYKVFDGIPNFCRNITPDLGKRYSILIVKMTYYFFPFNERTEKIKIFKETYPKWRILKHISGYNQKIFEKNIPSDGLVDRIQIARYPLNSGHAVPHTDPYLYQRFFISTYFSKKGIDYDKGGFYALKKNKKEIDVEKFLDVGDLCFGLATITHGVHKSSGSKKNKILINDLRSGRWWLGMYTLESDYSKNRHTAKEVKIKT